MDLEECILVRQFVDSLFIPDFVFIVLIRVETGRIHGFDLSG